MDSKPPTGTAVQHAEAEQAIAQVTATLPVCAHGMLPLPTTGKCDGFDVANVALAIEFLSQCGKTKSPNRSSYGIKHEIERWGCARGLQCYISNGELIIAAMALGFPYTWDGVGPNIIIGIAAKDVRRLLNGERANATG